MGWEGAVEHIPPDGAISYADPAAKAGAEEALLRKRNTPIRLLGVAAELLRQAALPGCLSQPES